MIACIGRLFAGLVIDIRSSDTDFNERREEETDERARSQARRIFSSVARRACTTSCFASTTGVYDHGRVRQGDGVRRIRARLTLARSFADVGGR